ncbi:sensor histidine kinase [uncultured Gemmiger sp.]|uniref:sensor histidine kinase n=1 Tax=uncultured Gemmiger sp. TaxID=1623490 RepID=UPI002610C893|nr:sensor histidine kinase [uncultured Gemmiger sp.]
MMNALRPMLELSVVFPGLLLPYFPVYGELKCPPGKLLRWILPLLLALSIGGGWACYVFHISTLFPVAVLALGAAVIYVKSLHISLWKSRTIALASCALFCCINSLFRAFNAAYLLRVGADGGDLWFSLPVALGYILTCWAIVGATYYPATHIVRTMVEDDNFAPTWYVFWILPIAFIALNLFMVPHQRQNLYVGRMLQGYIVISLALLFLLGWFYAVFLLMATSLNHNIKLQQENHFLSMQREQYENLQSAIEEARQARHDMRHYFNQLSVLAEEGDLDGIKTYLTGATGKIPNLDMSFCANRAADSVLGYYCALAKRESIPFHTQIDLPETVPVDEIDMCLVLSNLLENALEASLRTTPARRRIKVTAYIHGGRRLLIQVENTFDGEVREKKGVFQSSKRRGDGVGIQSVRRIAEKTNGASTFSYEDGVFLAKVMICGTL